MSEQEYQPPASNGPPEKRSRKGLYWILGGIGLLVVLGCSGIICCGVLAPYLVNSHVQTLAANLPAVQEHIGEIKGFTMNAEALVKANEGHDSADGNLLVYDLTGDKGAGQLQLVLSPDGQTISTAKLTMDDGTVYDGHLNP